jgi:hypothetical protein
MESQAEEGASLVVSRRWHFAALAFVVGLTLLRALRSRLRARKTARQQLAQAIDGLDEAELRERFHGLAQAFRLTHAGAGRPRSVGDTELEKFMALGVVECVNRPHVAAGVLEIYKLTALGEAVDARLDLLDRAAAKPARRRAIRWPPIALRRSG